MKRHMEEVNGIHMDHCDVVVHVTKEAFEEAFENLVKAAYRSEDAQEEERICRSYVKSLEEKSKEIRIKHCFK